MSRFYTEAKTSPKRTLIKHVLPDYINLSDVSPADAAVHVSAPAADAGKESSPEVATPSTKQAAKPATPKKEPPTWIDDPKVLNQRVDALEAQVEFYAQCYGDADCQD